MASFLKYHTKMCLSAFKPSRNHCPINFHCPLLGPVFNRVKVSISDNQHCNRYRLYVVIELSLFWTQIIHFKCPKNLKQYYVLYFERKSFSLLTVPQVTALWTFLGSSQTFHHCLVVLSSFIQWWLIWVTIKSSEGGLWMICWLVEERTVCSFHSEFFPSSAL